MMQLDIITFGPESHIVFHKVLSFLQNAHQQSLFKSIFVIASTIGFCFAAFEGIGGFDIKKAFKWAMTLFITISVFWQITIAVKVKRVSFSSIADISAAEPSTFKIPIGIGLPLCVLTQISYAIGQLSVNSFGVTSDVGEGFLSPLVFLTNTSKISSKKETRENFRSFAHGCIIMDISSGLYTVEQLSKVELEDGYKSLNDFFKKKSSGVRRARLTHQPDSTVAEVIYPACNDAFNVITSFDNNFEVDNWRNLFQTESTQALGIDFISKKSGNFLAAALAKNMIFDGIDSASQSTNAIQVYSAIKSNMQQKNYFLLSGSLMSKWLPALHTILLAIFSAAFPLIIAISCLPSGASILINYIYTLAWITSWYPLFIMVNFIFLEIASYSIKMHPSISDVAAAQDQAAYMLALAGYAVSLIPLISVALVKGAGQAMGIANVVTSGINQSAGSTAEEITTGNINVGNSSAFNHSAHNRQVHSISHGNIGNIQADSNDHMTSGRLKISLSPDGTPKVIQEIESSTSVRNQGQTQVSLKDTESVQSAKNDTQSKTEANVFQHSLDKIDNADISRGFNYMNQSLAKVNLDAGVGISASSSSIGASPKSDGQASLSIGAGLGKNWMQNWQYMTQISTKWNEVVGNQYNVNNSDINSKSLNKLEDVSLTDDNSSLVIQNIGHQILTSYIPKMPDGTVDEILNNCTGVVNNAQSFLYEAFDKKKAEVIQKSLSEWTAGALDNVGNIANKIKETDKEQSRIEELSN